MYGIEPMAGMKTTALTSAPRSGFPSDVSARSCRVFSPTAGTAGEVSTPRRSAPTVRVSGPWERPQLVRAAVAPRTSSAHGIARATEVMEAAGATKTLATSPLRPSGWHLLGTCRMGDFPAGSVVDRWGRAHDVPNLFIVDGSIVVTSAAVNPTSTIQALALHCADYIVRERANLLG